MKSLIDFIPVDERLITIEDTEEIAFHSHKNFVQLFYPSEAKEGDPVTSAIFIFMIFILNYLSHQDKS